MHISVSNLHPDLADDSDDASEIGERRAAADDIEEGPEKDVDVSGANGRGG